MLGFKFGEEDLILVEISYHNIVRMGEFIRLLRTDSRTQDKFIEQVTITKEQQEIYMRKHMNNYFICCDKFSWVPLGYVGVVDNDIRFCVVPYYWGRGIGTFMLKEIIKKYPKAKGKIKKGNVASIKAFVKAEVPFELI